MPDIRYVQMQSTSRLTLTQRAARYAIFALLALAAALLVFLLAMTQPRFATPVVNSALTIWGPEGAKTASAHLRFPALNTLVTRDLDLPDLVSSNRTELSANILGFLPGIPWLSKVTASQGAFTVPAHSGKEGEESGFDIRELIDRIALDNITITVNADRPDRKVQLVSGKGSIQSGDVTISATGAKTEITFTGNADATTGRKLGGTLHMKGENIADLAALFDLAAPDTPPYDLTAGLSLRDGTTDLAIREGTVGDSDLTGTVSVDTARDTPFITADLVSKVLDFDDLGVIFALPGRTDNGETVGEVQVEARQAYVRDDRMVPNIEIDFARLDAVDGQVHYRADAVEDDTLDLSGVELDVSINGRVVKATQARFAFSQGEIDAYATLDGSQDPPVTNVEGAINGVALASLSLDKIARGLVDGRFKAEMRGDQLREALGNSDGSFALWSTETEVLALGAEALGLDLGEALVLLASEGQDGQVFTPARCFAFVMDVDKGLGTLNPAVLDTEDSLIVMNGNVNLGTEQIDIKIRSDAKDASWGSLIGNVSLGGTLRDPTVNPLSGGTVLQVALAVVLAEFAGPLAALPFIETGNAPDAPCGAVLARAQNAEG